MSQYALDSLATEENFDEIGYLLMNPDVAKAVKAGICPSGLEHLRTHGSLEGRLQRISTKIAAPKQRKLDRIRSILRNDMPSVTNENCIDFLSDELRAQFNIVDTENVSSNPYDEDANALIEKYQNGLILDCGAGRRGTYYDNVVNFEIVSYDTTDVRGVGEKLPFRDNSFDAVFSLAVLEHVKDPFQCASEIVRVLKPGGELFCVVPFLQPMHGYPNHYYNMTEQGIRNLFEPDVCIDRHEVLSYETPIYTLTWVLRSWIEGLHGEAKDEFLNMKVSDLMGSPASYEGRSFVRHLSREKNFELACGTTIFGTKKPIPHEAMRLVEMKNLLS